MHERATTVSVHILCTVDLVLGMKVYGDENARIWKTPGMKMNRYETSRIPCDISSGTPRQITDYLSLGMQFVICFTLAHLEDYRLYVV